MIKPKRLQEGATIGVISPASPSENRSEVVRAKEYLEGLGYKVVIGKNVMKMDLSKPGDLRSIRFTHTIVGGEIKYSL